MNAKVLTLKSAFLKTSSVVTSNSSGLVGFHTPGRLRSRSYMVLWQRNMKTVSGHPMKARDGENRAKFHSEISRKHIYSIKTTSGHS